MKKVITFLLAFGLFISACITDRDKIDPDSNGGENLPGTTTDIGQPVGDKVSKSIGAEGGSLTSADGKVTLTVPAGAVSASTSFSIQPINNRLDGGVGNAYRFEPEGAQFKQPLIANFTYTEEEMSSKNPEGLRFGYQKEDGIWYAVPGQKVDKAKKQVSVPMYHFSDWTLFERYYLASSLPGADENEILSLGQTAHLFVMEWPLLDSQKEEVALRQQQIGKEKIGNWTLAGSGSLKPTLEGEAIYTASPAPSAQNPVTISVEITFPNSPAKVILLTQITVGLGYIKVRFNGKTYMMSGVSLYDEDDAIELGGGTPEAGFTLEVNTKKTGIFPFGPTDRQSNVSGIDFGPAGDLPYKSLRGWCADNPILSLGHVNVQYYREGRYVKGTFGGHLVGNKNEECDNSGPDIIGEFHVATLP